MVIVCETNYLCGDNIMNSLKTFTHFFAPQKLILKSTVVYDLYYKLRMLRKLSKLFKIQVSLRNDKNFIGF